MHAPTWNSMGKGEIIVGWKFGNEHNEHNRAPQNLHGYWCESI